MQKAIHVKYSESLASKLRLNTKDFEREMKMNLLVKIYEIVKISLGTGTKVLRIWRIEFWDHLVKHKVSIFGLSTLDELNEDIANV